MNLEIKKWERFRFGDIIDNIYKSKAYNRSDMQTFDYYDCFLIPHVTRTELNNSVDCFVDKTNFDCIEPGNAITIGDTTSTISYQKDEFITGDHIVVVRANWLNEYTGLFIVTLLLKEKYRYSYGRAYIMDSIKNTEIMLPVNNGNPDWIWIEKYIKSLNYNLPKTNNKKYEKISLDNWREFKIKELFDVSLPSGDIKADDCDEGEIALVSSGETNNGIVKYIKKTEEYDSELFSSNKITVDMFCHAYYQSKDFYSVSHGRVNILTPKFKMNKYIGLFITSIINLEQYKYSYGRAVYSNVISNMTIKLPVNEKNVIDLRYMEEYIKQLPNADLI
ncbi:MAG: restriction endonuclease subunit S [Bacilli bacterium]